MGWIGGENGQQLQIHLSASHDAERFLKAGQELSSQTPRGFAADYVSKSHQQLCSWHQHSPDGVKQQLMMAKNNPARLLEG